MISLIQPLAIGLAAGVAAGMFGIGGGIIIVPLLVLVLAIPQHSAHAISLAALLLPVGALGAWKYWQAGKLLPDHLPIALLIAVGILIGGLFGAKLALQLPQDTLRRMFAVFLVLVATKLWFSK